MSSNQDKQYTKVIKKVNKISIGDDDIRRYFGPQAKIITYDNLKNYNSIDELLPNEKDYAFILYLNSQHSGHWILLTRYKTMSGHCVIEYWDPYGKQIDDPLHWHNKRKLEGMGVDEPYLTNLISDAVNNKNCTYIENRTKYQKYGDVKSCGRHCIFRLMNFLECNRNAQDYYKYMKQLKKQLKVSYDDIVSGFINKKVFNKKI